MKRALRGAGFELARFKPDGTFEKRRQALLEKQKVDLVLDVGAHAGEFGQALRHGGYGGRIVSFEPLAEHCARLQTVADADGRWICRRTAIGDRVGKAEIHISGNDGFSSSVREMAPIHEAAEPTSSYVGSETVQVATLDEAAAGLTDPSDRLMLKVDVQGYEPEVLAGAGVTLQRCRLVELELALVELYEGQAMFSELVDRMAEYDFVLTDLEPGFRDGRTSQLLQIDGIFVR